MRRGTFLAVNRPVDANIASMLGCHGTVASRISCPIMATEFLKMFACSLAIVSALVLASASPEATAVSKQTPPGAGEILATVNGTPITAQQVEVAYRTDQARRAESMIVPPPSAQRIIKKRLLQDLIDFELLYQEAVSRGINVPDEEVERLAAECRSDKPGRTRLPSEVAMTMTDHELKSFLNRSIAVERLVDELSKEVSVTVEAAHDYYESNRSKYVAREEVLTRQILVRVPSLEDEADAKLKLERIREDIDAGTDFAEVARKYSEGPAAEHGGDLGWFSRGAMAAGFERIVFSTPVGTVSEPIRTRFGYHLIKVEAHHERRQLSFDEVRDRIVEKLKAGKTDRLVRRLTRNLRQQGNVWYKDK